MIPSGILFDSVGKINIIGNGVVIDLGSLCEELDAIQQAGFSHNNLMISEDAFLVLPFHVDYDKRKNVSQKDGGIGSTGRGIGPACGDKNQRVGVQIRDLYNPDLLRKKIEHRLRHFEILRRGEFIQSLFKKPAENNQMELQSKITDMYVFLALTHHQRFSKNLPSLRIKNF